MDVNGTPVHLVNGHADWNAVLAGSEGFVWDEDFQGVRLQQVTQRFPASIDAVLDPADRRGAAADRFGHIYWIDEARRGISFLPRGKSGARLYWTLDELNRDCGEHADLFKPVADPAPAEPDRRLSGLTITRGNFLLVGTLNPAGLLVFDLHGGGPPTLRPWPGGEAAGPFVFTDDGNSGAWLLERTSGSSRVWHLDQWLRFRGAEWLDDNNVENFSSCGDGSSAEDAVRLGDAVPVLPDAGSATDVVGLSGRAFLLLEDAGGFSRIIYVFDGIVRDSIALDETLLGDSIEPPAQIAGHAIALRPKSQTLPGRIDATLLVAGLGGNQSYAFALRAEDAAVSLLPQPDFWPMRSYAGRGLVGNGEHTLYDIGRGADTRWVPLAPHPRRRFVQGGELRGLVFDSGQPGCLWHRLMIDACLPAGVELTVRTRASERLQDLSLQAFSAPEPALYRRGDGAEIEFYRPLDDHPASGTWETLFQAAEGRWLEVCITVASGGRVSPYLRALRVYSPRFSYLSRYLPDVYQRDPTSASFLDRFLANVEGLFTGLEERIAKAEGYFDPRITPPEFLDWLAGWFDAELDDDWDEARRRLFIQYAEALYRWRGTVPGLMALLSLAVDRCVDVDLLDALKYGEPIDTSGRGFRLRIVERFLVREFGGLVLGDPTGTTTLAVSDADAAWDPALGVEPLHAEWRDFLAASAETPAADATLSPVEPGDRAEATLWRAFMASRPFTYALITVDDVAFYRLFLAQRYLTVEALNIAYGLSGEAAYASFDDVDLPAEDAFPAEGAALIDWMRFATIAMPIRANAHRFSVLMPTEPGEDSAARRLRLDRIAAVIDFAKPAHTAFDVLPFWALFQVGKARLGLDTQLGEGARYTAIELGVTGVGEGILAHGHPWNLQDRAITGRDTVSEMKL